MKITFIAIGTRGDVQPTIALAKSLSALGHEVAIVASICFKPWIEANGVRVVPSAVNFHDIMTSKVGHDWVENSEDSVKYIELTKGIFSKFGLQMMKDAWDGCKGTDLIVSNHLSQIYATAIAEKLGAIHVSIHLMPTLMRTHHWLPFPPALLYESSEDNDGYLDQWLIGPIIWQLIGDISNQFRGEVLNLEPQNFVQNQRQLHKIQILQGFSSLIVEVPPDTPANIQTTGFYFLNEPEHWQPPEILKDFIEKGDPPVYIGFGSMTGSNPDTFTHTIIKALELSGKRAVLQSGWAGLGNTELPPHIFLLKNPVPFVWLFPKTSAIVHHGGAGTSAEAFRAGLPMVVVPHMADQSFWGERAQALGVAPSIVPRSDLDAIKLSAAIREATNNQSMINKAAELGAKIRSEEGLKAASQAILEALGVN